MAYNEQYFLGHSAVEQRRLQQQAGELAEESAELLPLPTKELIEELRVIGHGRA